MRRGETWRETTAFWGYRGAEQAALLLPERVGRPAFIAAGHLAYRCCGRPRATVTANQAQVLGLHMEDERVRRSTQAAFRLYARYWYDILRLPGMSPATVDARTEVVGRHHVDAVLAQGRGCVAALAHMGNWDLAGRHFADHGYRIATVVEQPPQARVSELLLRLRRALGVRIIPLGEADIAGELARLLAENWLVVLLADRVLSGHGVEVEMFGAIRRVPAGPAVLSLASGAALLVCAVYTMPGGWRIEVGAPLSVERRGDQRSDVRRLSQRMATELERAIAAKPSDWHLFQPGWPAPAAAERS